MKFSEYALGLMPFCSAGKNEPDFFTELIGNFIQDAAMDACKILKRKADTRYRYIKGSRNIQPRDAHYLYDHRDINKFTQWVDEQMDYSDSYQAVSDWLIDNNVQVNGYDVADACASLLETIILETINGTVSSNESTVSYEYDFRLVDEIAQKIKALPRPAEIPVPDVETHEEQLYINELYLAYGDAEGIDSFVKESLISYPEYNDDLTDRRIDFYAAESIRRGVMELGNGGLANQFDILKDETHDSVKDTARRSHPNGYERMLSVMEQAVNLTPKNYLLSESPYWISGKIKKGVCHHLVNDGKLKWVKKKNGQ